MYLVQLLLPVAANDGRQFDADMFAAVRQELTEKFGGVTAYTQAPALGAWRSGVEIIRDTMLLFEVMQPKPRRKWWRAYREELEQRFEQSLIIVRAHRIRLL